MMLLEQEYEIFEMEINLSSNPVWGILKLVLGCCAFVFSIVILIQIIFYKLVVKNKIPHSEFLNDVFVFFEFKMARFISSIFFSSIAIYILATVVKGTIKFGLRFLFCMPIHPMLVGRTFINSFLFNLMLVMLTTPAIIHFIIELFEAYLRGTSAAFIFTGLVRKMKWFKWFYETKLFFYVYLGFAFLSLVYLLCKPNNDRYNVKKMIEERKKIQALR